MLFYNYADKSGVFDSGLRQVKRFCKSVFLPPLCRPQSFPKIHFHCLVLSKFEKKGRYEPHLAPKVGMTGPHLAPKVGGHIPTQVPLTRPLLFTSLFTALHSVPDNSGCEKEAQEMLLLHLLIGFLPAKQTGNSSEEEEEQELQRASGNHSGEEIHSL